MKIALCISGNLRRFEECANTNFFRTLAQGCDVYVSTWDTIYPLSSCNTGLLLQSPNTDIDRVKAVYNTDNVRVHTSISFDNQAYNHFDSINFGKIADYKSMWYLIKDSIEFALSSTTYDLIIRFRPDIFLHSQIDKHECNLTFPSCVWFDNIYKGTDILFKGNSSMMQKIAAYYDNIDKYITNATIENWHERFFNKYLDDNHIKYDIDNNIRFQLLRSNNALTVGFYDNSGTLIQIPGI